MYDQVILIGYVGKQPEIRHANGAYRATFRLVTTKFWKDEDGEVHHSSREHSCVLWSDDLGRFGERVRIGTPLFVEGELAHSGEEHRGVDRCRFQVRVRRYRVLDPWCGGGRELLEERGGAGGRAGRTVRFVTRGGGGEEA